MTTLRRRLPENLALRRFGVLPATLSETLGATFEDPTLSLSEMIGTHLDIERERGEFPQEDEGFLIGPGGVAARQYPLGTMRPEKDLSPLEAPETLNERYGDLGLKFDRPTRRNVAKILAEQKREERIRQDIIARGPSGVVAGSAQVGTALVRAVLDPLNIAAALIPVTREARLAGFLARFGKQGERLARGVIEGAVGNAIIEIPVAAMARQQQLDYEMSDALMNIAFGGILGGGLHVVGGRFSDWIDAKRVETKEAALRTSVSQLAQGKRIEIGSILDLDGPSFHEAVLSTTAVGRRLEAARRISLDVVSEVERRGVPVEEVNRLVRKEAPDVYTRLDQIDAEIPRLRGVSEENIAKAQATEPVIERIDEIRAKLKETRDKRAIRRLERNLERERARLTEFGLSADTGAAKRQIKALKGDKETRKIKTLEKERRDLRHKAERVAEKVMRDLDTRRVGVRVTVTQRPRTPPDIRDLAHKDALPDRDITADFQASENVVDMLQKAPVDFNGDSARSEADFAVDMLRRLNEQNILTEGDMREIEEIEILSQRGDAYGNAVRQAGACLMGKV